MPDTKLSAYQGSKSSNGKGKLQIPLRVTKGIEGSKLTVKKDLSKLSSRMGANPAMNRLKMAQLSNLNAIPDVTPVPPPQGGSAGGLTPATTVEVEMVTQAGELLITQDGYNLITN